MYQNNYYDYFQSRQSTGEDVNSSCGSLNNSNIYNDAYYNNYWYSRSDCSSSSVESTSPSTNRQQPYNYYNNYYYSTPTNYQPDKQTTETSFETIDFITAPKVNEDELEMDKSVEDKFKKEILPLLNSMNGDSNGLKRRMRTSFSDDQRLYLLKIFEKTIYPSKEMLEELSKKLNVTSTIIQTWFKNMRAKKKKVTKVVV